MKKTLLMFGVALAAGFVVVATRARAEPAAFACPEIVPTFCQTIDLEIICGPGCSVSIAGRN